MIMEHATIKRADPEIRFGARERRHINAIEQRMKHIHALAVVQQYAALLRAEQKMPRSDRQHAGDGTSLGFFGHDLPEGAAVEGEDSIRSRCDEKLPFMRIAQNACR